MRRTLEERAAIWRKFRGLSEREIAAEAAVFIEAIDEQPHEDQP